MKCLDSHRPQGVVRSRTAEVQQLLRIKEEVASVWSPGLEQNRDLESVHIKPEQEKLWTSQGGEKLNGLEETDITRFPFTVAVKHEDDKEDLKSLQLHQSQTEEER